MTRAQEKAIQEHQYQLRKERRIVEPLRVTSYEGIIYTEVGSVTVRIGRSGGIEVPALRSYLDSLEAAVNADKHFERQRQRDDVNPLRAEAFETGHFNGRFDPKQNRCVGDRKCPHCQ